MKKILTCIFCAAAMLLTGCGGNSVTVDGADIAIQLADESELKVVLPEGWTASTGDELLEEMLPESGYGSADELTAALEEAGVTYYVRMGSDGGAAVISSRDMTPETIDEEQMTCEEYARTAHDSAIFEYYASGYKTGSDSSFSQAAHGGIDGWQSYFEVFSTDEEPEFILGFTEFFFEKGSLYYSMRAFYFDQSMKETTMSLISQINT